MLRHCQVPLCRNILLRNIKGYAVCFHIVRWYDSVRAAPAIRRCYRSMSTAQTIRKRGISGERSAVVLDPTADLAVVKCRVESRCECARWPGGHNAGSLPVKQPKKMLMCGRCGKGRRAAVEIIDPRTEEPAVYCQRCAERAALGHLFKRQTPPLRRIHADDAAQTFIAVTG